MNSSSVTGSCSSFPPRFIVGNIKRLDAIKRNRQVRSFHQRPMKLDIVPLAHWLRRITSPSYYLSVRKLLKERYLRWVHNFGFEPLPTENNTAPRRCSY